MVFDLPSALLMIGVASSAIIKDGSSFDLPSHPKFKAMADWRSRITTEPGKLGGKPCVRGMRISVADVLEYLAADMSIEEILADFPYLEREDILACLAYAAERERERGATPQPA
jgi:uncharacterized protein (DUF433 family)